MSSSKAGSMAIDDARQVLCRELARCINAGSFAVRVRVVKSGDHPVAVMFYAHQPNGWQRRPDSIEHPPLITALDEILAMLASHHHDDWSAQCRSHTDGYETELQFHRDKFDGRSGGKLESVLTGLLFRDSHDSKKDSRRSVRTPRPTRSNT